MRESAATFQRMGATVEERVYSGMGHTVNRDELDSVAALLAPGATLLVRVAE